MSLDQNVIEDQNFLEITYRWYEPYHKAACIFFGVWNILSFILFYNELLKLVSGQMPALKAAVATLLFVLLWLVPVYWMLVLALNRTVIQLTRKEMVVRHGPLPYFISNEIFPTRDLRNIWLENADPESEEGEGATDIIAVLKNGEERTVIKNVKDTMDSEIIRDRINAWLEKAGGTSRRTPKSISPPNPMVNKAT
ncbi:hypothetical protein B2D07_05060 [Desulfococcus multivorans]|uniref:DUF304 domain-containing protein n=1 Tax=Desulfococcus multivorans DSM 2059 TaxID=1121405 RepID=S7TNW4_DESML|nr:uncharacterized protein Dmul_10420 [Desulfococcus multivorans]AQV00202.1 hypothetical protein B2D07_05060 [Desulfococcus multivorans]EPR38902.1 hypothetical protein dsmv_0312 [Desulfococcus multivorans DSM 2059]SJZ67641.1 hypothetical protein SAMN02745446_01338 [Desulfococcus multivorans DSM 2059]